MSPSVADEQLKVIKSTCKKCNGIVQVSTIGTMTNQDKQELLSEAMQEDLLVTKTTTKEYDADFAAGRVRWCECD